MLIPCIDLQGGQAVQLIGGRKRELTVVDVFGLLEKFVGHEWLHLIDLDAALDRPPNEQLLRELIRRARRRGFQVRVGGGIRTVLRARRFVALGATQVIIGSAAFRKGKPDIPFLRKLIREVDRRCVILALDTKNGRITTHGWRRSIAHRAENVMAEFECYCAGFLCTDVNREGTMTGANLAWLRTLRAATDLPIIAAGGIRTRREVAALERLGIDAAVGMALYKGKLR